MMSFKYKIVVVIAMTLVSLGLFGATKKAYAVYPDDGGGSYASNISPVPNSAKWNPPSTSYPGSGDLAGDSTPYYDVGNVPGIYDKSTAKMKILARANASFSLTVDNAGAGCNSAASAGLRGPDYSENSPVGGPSTFYYIMNGSNTVIATSRLFTAADGCNDFTFNNINTNTGTDLKGGVDANYGYDKYFWVVAQISDLNVQGENSFRITSSDASYIVSIGDAITGYGFRDNDLNNGNHWTSSIIFSVNQSCTNLTTTQNGTISYFDADANHPGWNPNLTFQLQRAAWGTSNWVDSAGGTKTYTDLVNTPTGVLFTGSFSSDYRYRVLLKNVGVRNTIFLKIGDSGAGAGLSQLAARFHWTLGTCGGVAAHCTATINGVEQANLKVTADSTVTWKFYNDGPTAWTTTDSPLTQYARFIDGVRKSTTTIPNSVASGGSFSINTNETLPGTGNKVVKYQMWQSAKGGFGKTCSVTLTPPGGGSSGGTIDAQCDYIHIRGVNSTATTSFGGVNRTITRVPTAVRVTAPDGVTTYTWLVNSGGNYGVTNQANGGSGSFDVPTYQIPGINFAMFPHQSYTIALAIEGVGGGASATYPDNGWWNPTNDANDVNYYYGPQIIYTTTSPTDCLTAVCSGTTPVDAEPGEKVTNLHAGINFTNKTTGSFSTNDPAGYQMVLNTSTGGLKTSNLRYDNITNGTSNITFDAEVDYTDYYSVSLLFQGQMLDIGQDNPCPAQEVQPKTRAFLQVTGGDLAAGGGFAQGSACLNKTDPHYVSPATTGSQYSGGIAAYGSTQNGVGSRTEFGIMSLGYNLGSFAGPIGLFSTDRVGAYSAILSNQTAQNGGLLNNTGTSDWHCATDYYSLTKKSNPAPSNFGGGAVPGASLQYTASGPVTITTSTINAGQQTTIYVDGDVIIDGDISYAPSYDATNPSNVPYFVLIARGSIVVTKNVTRIDGLYIAQPDIITGKGGVFSTCTIGSLCAKQLVVNGAVIAQEMRLLREHGTKGPLAADPNGICTPTGSGNCPPAEWFNYIPAMIVGRPNLGPTPTNYESLFNLPPVY